MARNRKAFDNVWAPKTLLVETAMKRPRQVEETAISLMAGTRVRQVTPERSARNAAIAFWLRHAPRFCSALDRAAEILIEGLGLA